ncbi:MAG: sulfur carrier protein ThiS [Rhodospirillaceae bacterium]
MNLGIRLNGKDETVTAATVLELLTGLGVDPQRRGLAVAVGGEVVPRRCWTERRLLAGDEVEVVRPLQGG